MTIHGGNARFLGPSFSPLLSADPDPINATTNIQKQKRIGRPRSLPQGAARVDAALPLPPDPAGPLWRAAPPLEFVLRKYVFIFTYVYVHLYALLGT